MLRFSFALVFLLSTMGHAWGGLAELFEETKALYGRVVRELSPLQANHKQVLERYNILGRATGKDLEQHLEHPDPILDLMDETLRDEAAARAQVDSNKEQSRWLLDLLKNLRTILDEGDPQKAQEFREEFLAYTWKSFWANLNGLHEKILNMNGPDSEIFQIPCDPSLEGPLRRLFAGRYETVAQPSIAVETRIFKHLFYTLRHALDAVDKRLFYDGALRESLTLKRKNRLDKTLKMIQCAPTLWPFLNHETEEPADGRGRPFTSDILLGRSVLPRPDGSAAAIFVHKEPSDLELWTWHGQGRPPKRLVQRRQGKILLRFKDNKKSYEVSRCKLTYGEAVDVDPTTIPPLATPPWLSPAPLPAPVLVLPLPIIAIPAAAPPLVPAAPLLGGPPAEQPAEPLEPLPRPAALPAAVEEASPAVDPDAALKALFPGWNARHRETVNALNDHKVREIPFKDVVQLLHALNLEVEHGAGSHCTVQNEHGALAGLAQPHKPGKTSGVLRTTLKKHLLPVLRTYLEEKGVTGLFA